MTRNDLCQAAVTGGMTLLTAFAETASVHGDVVAHRWQNGGGCP